MSEVGFGQIGQGFEERLPLLILLDTSSSMGVPAAEPPIKALNDGLRAWIDDMRSDPSLASSVEVAVMTFGGTPIVLDPRGGTVTPASAAEAFANVSELRVHPLIAQGVTPMVPAVERALALVEERKRLLDEQRIPRRRPVIWLLTDGSPTDDEGNLGADLDPLAQQLRAAEDDNRCLFFAVGVGAADEAALRRLAPTSTFMLQSTAYRDILRFASRSSDQSGRAQTAQEAYQAVAEEAEWLNELAEIERGNA